MATSIGFMEYLAEQLNECTGLTFKKMFGEYMVYLNGKPIILVCDETPFVKINELTQALLANNPTGIPYNGAKPHYILDIDDRETAVNVALELEKITPLPKPRKKPTK